MKSLEPLLVIIGAILFGGFAGHVATVASRDDFYSMCRNLPLAPNWTSAHTTFIDSGIRYALSCKKERAGDG